MKYRIEYVDGSRCTIVQNRNELIERLRGMKAGIVDDVRKLYKSGVSDSVMKQYEQYIRN